MRKELVLENLGELQQGLAGPAVNQAISECLTDINQRSFVDTARKVTPALTPITGPSGELIGVSAGVNIKTSVPPMKLMQETLAVTITPDRDGKGIVKAHLSEPQTPLFNRDADSLETGSHN